MKILRFAIAAFLAATTLLTHSQQQNQDKLDRRIDSQGYWKAAAERGLTTPNPHVSVAPARYTGSEIMSISVITENSPDVVVVSGNTSQSENSIFVNPNDPENPLNSNNSTTQPGGGTSLYGADKLYSFDAGLTWQGDVQGPSGSNSGDPAALIGLNGRYYIGFINNASGQSVAWSDDQGATWQSAVVANAPSGFGNLLDKNHMWIDNSPSSPYEGNLYNAWTAFGGQNDNDIEVSRSTDDGATWSSTINVSNSLNAGSHSQGVNISTGPGGEVYVTFCIYDNWPSDEDAIAMARSLDGGQTYESFRVIENIRGIRNTGTGKDMRVNAFPSSAADISNGPNRGNIYIVWTNVGYPGINTGSDKDVYIIRSEDGGDTWSAPIRVNQDPAGLGKEHYLPWITCDPVTGTLSVIFYDDRNVSSAQCEVFCANSYDGGETWEDFKVSDVSFTPSPIPGLASGYFGDYLGISARNGRVYPVWTDNRTGTALAYVSPYTTSTISAPTNLSANVNEETGSVNLTWQHSGSPTFSYFKVYRNFTFLGQTVLPLFTDQLPAYGPYRYYVTAYYEAEGESGAAIVDVQWGNPQAQTDPQAIEAFLTPGSNTTIDLNLNNIGQLPLNYTSRFSIPGTAAASRAYCTGTGGCTEYIRRVEFNEVNNQSECNGYEDFTNLGTTVVSGDSFTVTVLNGTSAFSNDVCGIWIDWNQNENFTDDGAIAVSGSPGPGPYTATITVPDDAASGTTRMRIRIKRDAPVSPCGLSPNGEVEDYSINVIGWVSASPMDGTIDPGSSQPIAVELDAAGLDLGDYQVDYIISSNDPDNGEITVPVILHVTDIALQISADKDSLCLGGSTTLHALATGGSGNFSYSWTSVPEGFTSTDPNPVVNPAVTTTYIVELTDGSMTLEEQITITVLDLPSVSLGDDLSACEGGQAVIDAGSGFAGYFWSNGQTTQQITVSVAGTYWVEVTNEFGCAARDTIEFSLNALPVVDLGEDQNFCEGSSVMLSAGTGFASYEWSNGASSYYISVSEPGAYSVTVTDENGCTAQDEALLTMDPLPLAPEVTSGPLSVDNYLTPASTFTSTEGTHAASWEWSLTPANSGQLDPDGTSAQVTWAAGFTGTAQLAVRSLNDCGESAWSASYEVAVYSSQGIGEEKAIAGMRIFPNPNDGQFILELTSQREQIIGFRITSPMGSVIIDEKETVSAGKWQKSFNMSTLPAGSYQLVILDEKGRMIGREQVVVK